ncbi:hypothetical protein JCM4814A_93850 [Streptomyces phaeofaciens JCM 4814]|uniref:Uncharacterized protein n=1 Tax=Streptomyces phaeofaciens TaxID=68254 RepID=A0A918HT53_9ACTN|nr:hypothetical protein GCM10010226_89240 [Streptomyces phaeofaciens]
MTAEQPVPLQQAEAQATLAREWTAQTVGRPEQHAKAAGGVGPKTAPYWQAQIARRPDECRSAHMPGQDEHPPVPEIE